MAGAGAGATRPPKWLHNTSGGGAMSGETSFYETNNEMDNGETSGVAGAGAGATRPPKRLHDMSGGGAMSGETSFYETKNETDHGKTSAYNKKTRRARETRAATSRTPRCTA